MLHPLGTTCLLPFLLLSCLNYRIQAKINQRHLTAQSSQVCTVRMRKCHLVLFRPKINQRHLTAQSSQVCLCAVHMRKSHVVY